MLPAAHRLRRTADFTAAVRSGVRRAGACAVVHHRPGQQSPGAGPSPAGTPALVGFVVGRQVGGSVVRHRVSRRLRAQMAQRLTVLPPGSRTVVRALPAAATATSAQLGADLDRMLTGPHGVLSRVARR